MYTRMFVVALGLVLNATALKVVLTNDDGWAEANVRAQFSSLLTAGYEALLSAPAENKSGSGSLDLPATPRQTACEFNSCPADSPAEGSDASDPRLNYVNSFPVTSVKFGIQTLAPQLFAGSAPDIIVSGPNVGGNTGLAAFFSGTVGAASEAAKEGIPAIAFSGATGTQRSFTELVAGDYSFVYADLSTKIVNTLVASAAPFLPSGVALNVNFPEVSATCATADDFKFILTRILPNPFVSDVQTCGTKHLPTEGDVIKKSGCLVSISVFNANTKLDSNANVQAMVLAKLSSILTCS